MKYEGRIWFHIYSCIYTCIKFYALGKFQFYAMELPTEVTRFYIKSLDLFHLTAESLYPLTSLSIIPSPALGHAFSVLSMSLTFFFFFFHMCDGYKPNTSKQTNKKKKQEKHNSFMSKGSKTLYTIRLGCEQCLDNYNYIKAGYRFDQNNHVSI